MNFKPKLNKRPDGTTYTVQELITLIQGQYDGPLSHDNVANSTVRVYTGPNFTGEQILSFVISTPTDSPWRRSIRIFADVPNVFVTYETPGDQVDAEDINALQESLQTTREELTSFITNGVIDAGFFNERNN